MYTPQDVGDNFLKDTASFSPVNTKFEPPGHLKFVLLTKVIVSPLFIQNQTTVPFGAALAVSIVSTLSAVPDSLVIFAVIPQGRVVNKPVLDNDTSPVAIVS